MTRANLAGRRIAFFTSVENFGGSELVMADVVEGTFQSGAEVVFWTPPDAPIRDVLARRSVTPIYRDWPRRSTPAPPPRETSSAPTVPATVSLRSRIWHGIIPAPLQRLMGFLLTARQFQRELQSVNPDLLLINANGSEAAAVAAGRWNKSRTLVVFHVAMTRFEGSPLAAAVDRLMTALTMHASSLVIHVSAAARDRLNRFVFLPKRRTVIMHNGVDGLARPSTLTRADLGIAGDEFVFCVASRLHPIKGHKHLLNAVRLAPEKFARTRILLCGDGPLESWVNAECLAPPLHGIVIPLGFRSDVLDIIRNSDCLVLPSESENFNLAALEASTLGKPVISTRVGGMAEAILHEETGLLVQPKSPEELLTAMTWMLQNRTAAEEMGARGKERALRLFTRKVATQRYLDLFSDRLTRLDPPSSMKAQPE